MRKYTKVVSLFLFVLTSFLAGNFEGFERGCVLSNGIFRSSCGEAYRLVAGCYMLLMLASGLLTIRAFHYPKKWTRLAVLGAVGLSLYASYLIVLQKMLTLQGQSEYTKLMGDAVVYDVEIAVLILSIFGYELFTFLKRDNPVP